MADESNVAVPADNTAPGAHNIRTVTVAIDNSAVVAGGQPEQQQVVTLADGAGHLIKPFVGGSLPVNNTEVVLLLQAMLVRLDLLCAYVISNYNPPDQLGLR